MCRLPCIMPSLPRENLPAKTTIHPSGPGGNPFIDISWLAIEEVNQQGPGTKAPQHSTRLTYLPNLQAALKSHMHSNHKLSCTNSETGHYSYCQSLLPHVHRGISNAFWSMSKLSLQMKRNVFHYRKGTLYIRNTLSALMSPPAFSVYSISKQTVLSILSLGRVVALETH